MKNKNHIYIILSGTFLTIGIIGFAISPFLFDSEISEKRSEISDFEYHRQLSSKNLYDANDWYRFAGITSNNAYVLSELNADRSILERKKKDYINESKFSLNSLVIAAHSAKGEFDINTIDLWNKWDTVSEPEEFFALQKQYSEFAMLELKKLEESIKSNRAQINRIETKRKWFWIICIIVQTFGMFIGIYHSYLKEINDNNYAQHINN